MQIVKGQIYIVGEQPSFQTRGHSVKMMLLHLQNTFGTELPDVDVGAIATGGCHVHGADDVVCTLARSGDRNWNSPLKIPLTPSPGGARARALLPCLSVGRPATLCTLAHEGMPYLGGGGGS